MWYDDVPLVVCAAPSTAPRDLVVNSVKGRLSWASVNWEEPRQTNGKVTGRNSVTRGNSTVK